MKRVSSGSCIKLPPPVLALRWEILRQIVDTIGLRAAESGGAIGIEEAGEAVGHYVFDERSQNSASTYSPEHTFLNRLFKREWNPKGIRLCGFVHSHPGCSNRPSIMDERYAGRILAAIKDMDYIWLPIVNTVPDTGFFRLTPWIVYDTRRGQRLVKAKVQLIGPRTSDKSMGDLCAPEKILSGNVLDEILISTQGSGRSFPGVRNFAGTVLIPCAPTAAQGPIPNDSTRTFIRVREAYDLNRMKNARMIVVGTGGAASWIEEMARAGIGQFVLVDPDVVTEENLATQQAYRKDIGRAKVECVRERILDINPGAKVVSLKERMDELSDEKVRELAEGPLGGMSAGITVICGMTDDFYAQARVNRLALKFSLPSLCAQVYKEGRGAEVTFTYPGVTPACHRCILSRRYRHYLEEGGSNEVTSHGTPIFSTTRLNAIKGFIAISMIHHGSRHPRWGGVLERIGSRNLVQIRMDPDIAGTLGIGVFERVFTGADKDRLFFDETVWLPQKPENPSTGYPPCPDCGGTGDLRNARDKIGDTRLS